MTWTALKYLKIHDYCPQYWDEFIIYLVWKFEQNLRLKICPISFRLKWSFVESIPGYYISAIARHWIASLGNRFLKPRSDKPFGQAVRTSRSDKPFGQAVRTSRSDKPFGQAVRTSRSDQLENGRLSCIVASVYVCMYVHSYVGTLTPRGEICPLGKMFILSSPPG
jgi:hypothetical protein